MCRLTTHIILFSRWTKWTLKYWCSESNVFETRYVGSQFQYSLTADAFLEELLKRLPLSPKIDKMTQLAMDGPNTYWLVLKKMNEKREKRNATLVVHWIVQIVCN